MQHNVHTLRRTLAWARAMRNHDDQVARMPAGRLMKPSEIRAWWWERFNLRMLAGAPITGSMDDYPLPRGRKWRADWQLQAQRDARAVHLYTQRRIRCGHNPWMLCATPEIRKRLPHVEARYTAI